MWKAKVTNATTSQLWEHQLRGLTEVQNLIANGAKSICVTSPTGGGKTRMMMSRLSDYDVKSATIYTDRKMLFNQLAENLDSKGFWYGKRASGHQTSSLPDIQLAMLQTEKLSVLKYNQRDVADGEEYHIDEAHNNCRGKTLELYAKHNGVRIGWTATPLDIGHAFDHLVVAGTNSELRKCGAHVKAFHYAPSEASKNVTGKITIGSGECGIKASRRKIFAQRIFGSVIENFHRLNPEQKPTILFGPDVAGSLYFCKKFNEAGVKSCHIDGEQCYIDGKLRKTNDEAREEITARLRSNDIKVCMNRYIMREGIDLPFLEHLIFATVFGSITSYLQAGGRLLRSHPGIEHVTVQDHGGCWWRFGSLNSDRSWDMNMTAQTYQALRNDVARESNGEDRAVVCPKCDAARAYGNECPFCGYKVDPKTIRRKIIETDGQLKAMEISEWKKRKPLNKSLKLQKEWAGKVYGTRKYYPQRTFAQLYADFARTHDWKYPARDWPLMPKRMVDWYMPVGDVSFEQLHG